MTLKKMQLTPTTLIECDRCGKAAFLAEAAEQQWNIVAAKGYVTGFLCHECQTDAEDLEAQVNESLLDYTKTTVDEQGRLRAPLKVNSTGDGSK